MVMNDALAAALSKLDNAQRAQKKSSIAVRSSRLIRTVLDILQKSGYIAAYTVEQQSDGDKIIIQSLETINRIGVIKPRFAFKSTEYQKVEKQYLPARDFGVIIVSTSQGIMTLDDAKQKNIGGKLIAYCY